MAKVSIIVPTYNVEQYLNECMNSIINQTLKDIEIICVDDGSTDNSGKILDEYASKDDRIKIIHKENSGYGCAMNVGMDNATGEFIGIVEPDDYILPEMYEVLYNKANENDVDLIKADFYRFIGSGTKLKKKYNKLDFTECYYNKVINPQEDLAPFRFIMNTWSGIYRREFIQKFNIRHNETPGASFQDNGFWFQTFMFATRIYFLNMPLYMNRRDNPNSSVKNKEKVYCITKEYEFIKNIIDSDIKLRKFLGVYWLKKFHNYVFNITRIDDIFHKEFMDNFSKEFHDAINRNEIDKQIFEETNELDLLELLYSNPNKFYKKITNKVNLIEKLFSIKHEGSRKIIRILGSKIKIKTLKLVEKEHYNNLNQEVFILKQNIKDLRKVLENLQKEIQMNNSHIYDWQTNFYKDFPHKFPIRLSENEISAFCKYISNAHNYLEFGSGGSTFFALENSNANIYSIESDSRWLDYLRSFKIIRDAENIQKLNFFDIFIGKIKYWGYPEDDTYINYYPQYSRKVFENINVDEIDICFVNGRFRVACALQTLLNCSKLEYLLIHDYPDRNNYHVIEKFFDVVEAIDTLYVFRKKKYINYLEIEKLYEEYKFVKE